jgi:hypothetical protein
MGYPGYPWIPQIIEPVCQFIHRPVCMPFYVSKFQRLEMATIQSQGMKMEILSLAENLLNFQFHYFFLTGYGFETAWRLQVDPFQYIQNKVVTKPQARSNCDNQFSK